MSDAPATHATACMPSFSGVRLDASSVAHGAAGLSAHQWVAMKLDMCHVLLPGASSCCSATECIISCVTGLPANQLVAMEANICRVLSLGAVPEPGVTPLRCLRALHARLGTVALDAQAAMAQSASPRRTRAAACLSSLAHLRRAAQMAINWPSFPTSSGVSLVEYVTCYLIAASFP